MEKKGRRGEMTLREILGLPFITESTMIAIYIPSLVTDKKSCVKGRIWEDRIANFTGKDELISEMDYSCRRDVVNVTLQARHI